MADQSQSQARAQAIAAGYSPEEVDAFIKNQGGDRTSAQRITSAFSPRNTGAASGSPAAPAPVSGGAPGMDASGMGSVAGINTVVNPTPTNGSASAVGSMAGLDAAAGGGGGEAGGGMLSPVMGSSLRSLGRRMPPMDTTDIAQRGKRVY